MSDQLVAEAATYTQQTQETNIHALSRIATRDPGKQAAADQRRRFRSHRDQLLDIHNIVTRTRRSNNSPYWARGRGVLPLPINEVIVTNKPIRAQFRNTDGLSDITTQILVMFVTIM
jgi:hypothetical protein